MAMMSDTSSTATTRDENEWPNIKPIDHVVKIEEDGRLWEGPYWFAVLCDPQLGFLHNNKTWDEELQSTRAAIHELNRLKPRFVIVIGDIAQKWPHEPNQEIRVAQLEDARKAFSELDSSIPLLITCGNHDVGNAPTRDSVARHEADFGQAYFFFWCGGVLHVVLNSGFFFDSSKMEEEAKEQMTWLKEMLESVTFERTPQHIMVYAHHPWYVHEWDEEDSDQFTVIPSLDRIVTSRHFQIKSSVRRELFSLFQRLGVRYSFHGHLHWNKVIDSGGVEMIVTAAIGRPLGADLSGMRVVKVDASGVDHTYYTTEEFPLSIPPSPVAKASPKKRVVSKKPVLPRVKDVRASRS